MTPTVAPPTEKTCRYGNHVIDESDRGGFTTFFHTDEEGNPDKPDEYACAKHDKEQRVKEFKATKVLTTHLMTEAYLDQNDRMRALGLSDGNYHPTTKLWFDDFVAECDAVSAAAKRWEREVWFGGQFPRPGRRGHQVGRWAPAPLPGVPEQEVLPGGQPPSLRASRRVEGLPGGRGGR